VSRLGLMNGSYLLSLKTRLTRLPMVHGGVKSGRKQKAWQKERIKLSWRKVAVLMWKQNAHTFKMIKITILSF